MDPSAKDHGAPADGRSMTDLEHLLPLLEIVSQHRPQPLPLYRGGSDPSEALHLLKELSHETRRVPLDHDEEHLVRWLPDLGR